MDTVLYFVQVLDGTNISSKVGVSQRTGIDESSVDSTTFAKDTMYSSTSSTTTTHSKASTSYTSSANTNLASTTIKINGSSNDTTGSSDSPRRPSRESIIQQMLRQQSENKSLTKDSSTAYSSIFSGTQQSSVDRKSSSGIGTESSGTSSNQAPLITRRKRPDWAEPTVSVDQAAVLKASLDRKGETTADKISYNLNSRRKSNSNSSNPCPPSAKSSNNNYSDHFQKVSSTVASKSVTSTTSSSVVEHNLNAKMSFLNYSPVNGTMTGNGEASRLARNTNESVIKTSLKTTSTSSAAAASEESNNISTNSAISPNNNGMINDQQQQRNISTTSGDSSAEPCV